MVEDLGGSFKKQGLVPIDHRVLPIASGIVIVHKFSKLLQLVT